MKNQPKKLNKTVKKPIKNKKAKKPVKDFIIPKQKDINLSPEAKEEIEAIIKESITRFKEDIGHKKIIKEFQTLENKVTEFLDDFIIMGHDLNGQRIVMVHASSQLAHDALMEHIRGTFLKIIQGNYY